MGGKMGGVRFVMVASIATGIVVGKDAAFAQGGSEHVQTLPPVEVTAPSEGVKRSRSREGPRIVRPRPRVVIPTAPAATASSASEIDADKVSASVNVVDSKQIERTGSPNVTDALLHNVPSVNLNEVSGNPFQPNLEFRGFVASPLSGTPQGLAVYQNGVRINEAFGDTVNWDLIPTAAIRSATIVTNNPAFGLNALGGAVDLQMKDGFSYHGTELNVMGGSFGRIQGSAQWGKQTDNNYAVYGALEGVHDDGFRNFSQSDVRRFYGDVAYRNDVNEFHLSMGVADNKFGATVTVPAELLQQYWGATYTTPQTTANRVGYLNLTGKVEAAPTWTIEGAAHLRFFGQKTVDGNPTGVQPCDDPTLLCFGDGATPANDVNGVQLSNPFPSSAFLGEIDRTSTRSTTAGFSLQATNDDKLFGHDNRFTIGGSYDTSVTWFNASAELATIGTDYVLSGSGIYLGQSGNPTVGEIGPVSLRTTNQYTGIYALDTFDVTNRFSITGGGRFNAAHISLEDQLGTALNGTHEYDRFNPIIGGTFKITPELTAYAGYSEANRAPTPLELGCADPSNPCTIAAFLVSDPDLKQVVSHTVEAGLRGTKDLNIGTLSWKLGGFRAKNTDDILAIPSPLLPGHGYYQNVGSTRRQGIEAEVNLKSSAFQVYASYSFIDARFLDSLQVGSNSPFADANGNVQILPGNQIPAVPRHRVKAGFDYAVTDAFKIGGDALWVSSQYFVGDESNQAPKLPSYAVFNAHASYQINKTFQLFGRIDNIFDKRYATYGTFFETDTLPNFANGGAPFTDPRSLSPARPRAFYAGLKATF
ncbi:TonB-dependent receptor [Bradyrhizobium sp. ISRA443]|uniref:TonB-dependent receptor n=1 Tax=unclassified Bradyrhizobium TaxID=2631580 RepID=UPI0024784001|nr:MULTISPECIES: TonB-dependent receptor [unclassified Bradyrhizobium]WGR97688.1 TonB-dependent receptor [Bradyrhizobium sp. ISRA436]WGS04578.1 TonB-dependent receptor [Bradyrhizobium sp. ISRA437]WGS11459.1 TonB-dependent receptor [Bradyrhizobium sp. ISRA443]